MKIIQVLQMSQQEAQLHNYVIQNISICMNPQKVTCFVCKKKIFMATKPRGIRKHHISYYPEITCWVHQDCHDRIHDPDNPLTSFIKYSREDSLKFYGVKLNGN